MAQGYAEPALRGGIGPRYDNYGRLIPDSPAVPQGGGNGLLDMGRQFIAQAPSSQPAPEPIRPQRAAARAPSGINGMDLLFGLEPDARVERTQSAPDAQARAINGVDLLFGDDTPEQGQQPAAQPQPSQPDMTQGPQGGGIAKSIIGAIKGTQDPREAQTSTVYDQFPGQLRWPTANAATLGASDPQMADIIEKNLGSNFIRREQDANGYDVLVTRGPDGQEQRGYVNRPGLDTQDVARTIYGALPYAVGGGAVGAATKGMGFLARAGLQAAGAGATSVAGDVAQIPMGSNQGIEPIKASIAAAGGVGGVALESLGSRAWQRFVTEPRLFDRSAGKLTQEGANIARQQGLDPAALEADVARTFAQTYARSGDASRAAIAAQEGEFGIPSTAGQRSKDPWQLTQEEAARRNLYGEKARDTMQAFDARQKEAVDFAARTRLPSDMRTQTVKQTGTMNPAGITQVSEMAPTADLGDGIRTGLRSAQDVAKAGEREAWEKVTDILPTPQSFDLLPDALAGRLGSLRVTNEMPRAASMAKALDDYVQGKAFNEPVAGVLKQAPVKTVDEMRRQLLAMYKSAQDPTDVAAAKAIYEGFNDWIDNAAEKALLSGSPEAAANLRAARDTTRVMQGLFSPQIKGSQAPAARIVSQVMANGDSPERIVQILFGTGPSSTIKEGTVEALKAMKGALSRYADPRIAGDTIADLKIAYWSRIVQSVRGEAHTPGVMLNNIKAALENQRSVVQELYSPDEVGQIRRLATALERIVYKPPNASGSGYTAAGLAKQFLGKLFEAVGGNSLLGRTALEMTGLPNRYGAVQAQRAVSQAVPRARGNVAPYSTSAGATYGRQRQGAQPLPDAQRALDLLEGAR